MKTFDFPRFAPHLRHIYPTFAPLLRHSKRRHYLTTCTLPGLILLAKSPIFPKFRHTYATLTLRWMGPLLTGEFRSRGNIYLILARCLVYFFMFMLKSLIFPDSRHIYATFAPLPRHIGQETQKFTKELEFNSDIYEGFSIH